MLVVCIRVDSAYILLFIGERLNKSLWRPAKLPSAIAATHPELQGYLLIPQSSLGPIGNASDARCESNGSRHRLTKAAFALAVLALILHGSCAWALQAPPPSAVVTDQSSLPDAPDASRSRAVPNPNESALGNIHGGVVDRDGAVYESASITLSQDASIVQSVRREKSDGNGRFSFTDVVPGPFQLTISSIGFSTQIVSGVLHTGESYEAPQIVLPISATTSEVRVTATAEQIAQEQVVQEEKQRVLGIIPNFYIAYASNPAPLNSRQKFHLALKSTTDPVAFLTSSVYAGIEQANNNFAGYGQGVQGYTKRFAANYADTFIGTMISSAALPSLFKQDPRYFYKGAGTIRSRTLYAIANAVVSKGDNGRWQPSYSSVIGGLAAGGISNLYYPARDRHGFSLTFENTLTGFASGAVQNLIQEFFIRKLTPKVPDYSPSQP
jgi:hypothetical protein